MKFHQRIDGVGLGQGGNKFLVWVNWQTRSWAIVLVRPEGVACLMATGTDWTTDRTPPGEKM